jgi:hypothetical protein
MQGCHNVDTSWLLGLTPSRGGVAYAVLTAEHSRSVENEPKQADVVVGYRRAAWLHM